MFSKKLEQTFTKEALLSSFEDIDSKTVGLDKITIDDFAKNLDENIDSLLSNVLANKYTPIPIEGIEIEKNSTEIRPIALSSLIDKIVQKALYFELNQYFDATFSNKSYGYRIGKSPARAINRTKDFINKGYIWVYKSDIDNFFETINHDLLLEILASEIEDKKIIRLISLYLQNGIFKNQEFISHSQGVHQGDILSPLLSNIYLDKMDKFLEEKGIEFVRYADDFILLFKTKKEIDKAVLELQEFLKTLHLSISEDKSYVANAIANGFTFLGVNFKNHTIKIDNERLQKKISELFKIAKESSTPQKYVENINSFVQGLSQYYLKIISKESSQFKLLFEALINATTQFVYYKRKSKKYKTKKLFKEAFRELNFMQELKKTQKKELIDRVVYGGFEKYLATKEYKADDKKLLLKRQKFAKAFSVSSTIYVSEFGSFIGLSKNKIVLKVKGKVVSKVPIKLCEQIIIANSGISFSSNLIKTSTENDISIDFLEKDNIYATLYSSNFTYAKNATLQLKVIQENRAINFAKKFIKAKAKNQLNYLKYLNRYHNEIEKEINSIEKKLPNIKKAQNNAQLMGTEGEISSVYWSAISKILADKVEFKNRVGKGAKDTVNSTLNYAYAILYSRVQKALIKAGLNLNISFLHTMQNNKPTLVYDFIEEFRAFIVDRAVVSMFNKNEPIEIDKKGMLTKSSKELIAKNIIERFGVYTKYRSKTMQLDNIISEQAYLLARAIKGETKYKPFIGKY